LNKKQDKIICTAQMLSPFLISSLQTLLDYSEDVLADWLLDL
jgi:hypothetical protein